MQVKTKNLAVGALVVLLVGLLWYRVIVSPMQSQASKANSAAVDLKSQATQTEHQVDILKKLSVDKPSNEELASAIPADPKFSEFLRQSDAIRASSGVAVQSITPSPPVAANGVGSITLSMTVVGTYQQVMSYIDQLLALPRLALVDNVAFTAGAAASNSPTGTTQTAGGPTGDVFAGQGSAPLLQAQLSMRLFTSRPPVSAVSTGTAAPVSATSSASAAGK